MQNLFVDDNFFKGNGLVWTIIQIVWYTNLVKQAKISLMIANKLVLEPNKINKLVG